VGAPADDQYADTDPSALTDFRPALDPYGTWSDDASYGTVWTPNPDAVDPGFQPYATGGQWDYDGTDYSWVSSYAWGWVCFHYGRWVWSQTRGWMWIPGREYAGAWVTWRVGDDGYAYVGWAPISPAWGWFGGGAALLGFAASEPWTFTPNQGLLGPQVTSRAAPGSQAAGLMGHTKPYVPATPGVSGSTYVAATPGVSSTPFQSPVPHGPSPSVLGIDASLVAHAATGSREVRARQLARPSTALALGAHAPVAHVVRMAPRGGVGGAGVRGGEARATGGARGRR
jgi:hypothetical protein